MLRHATHWDEVVNALGYEHLRRHLPEDHPVWKTYVGKDTPEHPMVRNPVTYPKLTVE